jgi:hypothetical protein
VKVEISGVEESNDTPKRIARRICRKNESDSVKAYENSLFRDWTYKKVIRRKKGICEDYANVFLNLAKAAGLESIKISGYSKSGDYFENKEFYWADHAWNLVKIDSSWHIIETTWGSGGTYYHLSKIKEIYGKVFHKIFLPKLKFKHQPTLEYFCPNPLIHNQKALTVVPEIQVLNCPIDLITFETEDTNAFNVIALQNRYDTCVWYNKYLDDFKGDTERQIDVSLISKVKEFNVRNNEHKFETYVAVLEDAIYNRNKNN